MVVDKKTNCVFKVIANWHEPRSTEGAAHFFSEKQRCEKQILRKLRCCLLLLLLNQNGIKRQQQLRFCRCV